MKVVMTAPLIVFALTACATTQVGKMAQVVAVVERIDREVVALYDAGKIPQPTFDRIVDIRVALDGALDVWRAALGAKDAAGEDRARLIVRTLLAELAAVLEAYGVEVV